MIEQDVIYIALCEKSTSQERAFSYLQQVANEFWTQYGDKVKQATRPYSFIEFGKKLKLNVLMK